MSWEKVATRTTPCPCGKGVIARTDYSDDWNRCESGYSIECPMCKTKYKIVSHSYYKHPGDFGTVHYLLNSEYPDYSGTRVADVFPDVESVRKLPFDEYLIRTYTSETLQDALSELNNVSAVSCLAGVAANIAKKHKRVFHSAKISVLRKYVEDACNNYNTIPDSKDNRLPIEKKEQEERAAYEAEMRKHLIHISL